MGSQGEIVMSKEQLELLLESAGGGAETLLIFPHNDPDPDAIASAVALQYLLDQTLGLQADIAYRGIIGRAENRALVRYLDYPLQALADTDLNQARPIALVDTQPGAGNNAWSPGARVVVVIDHHPWRRASRTAAVGFADVRPEVGASSTILVEYLQTAGFEPPPALATAMFYGIKTDTRGLSRDVSSADAEAYFYLQPRIDGEALADIERAQVPAAYFQSFATTLEETVVYQDAAISYVGPMDYPDMTAEIADLLLRLEQIEWVICLGLYQNSLILSVRTPSQHKDAGRLAQAIVGQDGVAGGHNAMAGGQVPLNGQEPEQLVSRLTHRALDYLGIGPGTTGYTLI